jgi:O-antigen/teichoic acid export membrane protein
MAPPTRTRRLLRLRAALTRSRHASLRIGWTVIDQGISALTNLVLSVMVAQSATASAFGAFAMAFLVYSLALGFSRALIGQPLQISFASASPNDFRSAARLALGAAVVVGSALSLITVVAGVAIGGQPGVALIALGLWFPALILQDTCRMAFFTEGTAKRAAAIDSVWGVLMIAGFLVARALGVADRIVISLTLWGFGAAVASLYGLKLLGVGARLRGSVRWMRDRHQLSRFLSAEYLLSVGVAQGGILAVGFVGTQAGVGALRAAQVLLGPANVLGTAAMVFTTTEVARRPSASVRQRWLMAAASSGGLASVTAAYVAVLLFLPDSWGEHLLGDTWSGARSVLLPMCLAALTASIGSGPSAALYGMGHARATFSINVLRAPLNIGLFIVCISAWGAAGAAWALAITELILLPLYFIRLRIALHADDTTAVPGTP